MTGGQFWNRRDDDLPTDTIEEVFRAYVEYSYTLLGYAYFI